MSQRNRSLVLCFAAVPLVALIAQLVFDEPWWTGDQRGQRLFRSGAYAEAARSFTSPAWHAISLYRAGEFEDAANALAGVPGAEAAYNRGNALVFQGKYEEAVESYERALALRPEWRAAEENRRIAASRIRTETALGEATEVGADDIVFDPDAPAGGDRQEVTGGEELDDETLSALWLRNVETRPADFLRAKFAYQNAVEDAK